MTETTLICPPSRARFDSCVRIALSALVLSLVCQTASAQVIIDGQSFESPAYSTTFDGDGKLEGQSASLPGDSTTAPWVASIGTTSTAIVQNSIAATGSQSVQVDRAANEAAGGGRWAVPVSGWPSKRYVCINWNMRVEDAGGAAGTFGPFFGIEAYDDDGVGAGQGLAGALGVDATTGDVLYQATSTGVLTESGSTVNFGEWNNFSIDLDFLLHEYTISLNNVMLLTEPFVDGSGLDQFTDADITAVAAAGDSVSQALTGTAYFDDYKVFQVDTKIPEPGTLALLLASAAALPLSRRRLR